MTNIGNDAGRSGATATGRVTFRFVENDVDLVDHQDYH
jgi:hypothetical protein